MDSKEVRFVTTVPAGYSPCDRCEGSLKGARRCRYDHCARWRWWFADEWQKVQKRFREA